MKITTKTALLIAPIILCASATLAADAAANWAQHCASCHGKDGSGSTMMGKKLGIKDYRDAKVQAAFSDAEVERAIKEGVKNKRQGDDETIRRQTFRCRHQGAGRLRSFLQEIAG